MSTTIGRRALRAPDLNDTPDVARDIQNLATDLQNVAVYNRGTPLPASGQVIGDLFRLTSDLTDGPNGTLYEWSGSAWIKSTPPADGSATQASARTLGPGASQAAPGNDARLSDARPASSVPTGVLTAGVHIAGLYSSRPAASAALNGARFFATDKFMEWQCIAAAWALVAIYAPEVTSLPTSPIDQQECIFVADATKGLKWHLRYRLASTSASKWEYIGGPEMNERGTNVSTGGGDFSTASTTYIDVPGMSGITLPLAGDWTVDYGFTELRSDTNGQGRWWGVVLNTGNPPVEHFYQSAVVSDFGRGSRYALDWTGLAAASVLRLRVKTSGVGTAVFNGGHLRVRPVRVG